MTDDSPAPAPAAALPPARKRMGCGAMVLIGLGVFVGLGVLGALAGDGPAKGGNGAGDGADPAALRPALPPIVELTAAQLFADYQANELRARQRFAGKRLLVSGQVSGVDLDFANRPIVLLKSGNQFMPVQARLVDAEQDDAAAFDPGQPITLLCGEVTEAIGIPMLSECSIDRQLRVGG